MIGEVLDGRYEVIRKVGGGGMGAVYEARHKGTGRRVAVKVISGNFAGNKTLVTRFEREALASGSIETQHIVQVLDTGTDPASGLPFMVMEYLTGEDLAAVLERIPVLPPDLALRITAQACLGLQKAHDAGVMHRDVKPGNLFLSRRDDGELIVKLLDFGIAKIKQDRAQQLEASGLTRTGHMLGSPLYMSPEQARGQKDIDQRTDLWSLGVVLHQMLAGRRPHEGIQALGELIIAICSEEPPLVQDLAPWVAPEIAAIVHGALQLDPARRCQSASDMLAAIKPLLPDGWSLKDDMLAPLPDEARKAAAPRFDGGAISGAQSIYRPSDPSLVGVGLDPTVAGAPLLASSRPGVPELRASETALAGAITASNAADTPPRAPPSRMRAAAVGVVVSAAAALVLLKVVTPPGPGEAPPEAPATSAAPAARPEAAPVAPAPIRTVKLVLVPSDVAAEVDGAAVTVRDGIIEISGPAGSTHEVRLKRGSSEVTGEITITESGPEPPKLELLDEAAPGGAPR